MYVTATERIVDEGEIFAEAGAVGAVYGLDRQPDGVTAVTVMFPDAPQVTTAYLGEDCQWAIARAG